MSEPVTRLNAALEGRYAIERELGEGGMATVYLAGDLKHDRNVALKVLKPELAAVVGAERFLAEIKTTARLQHPHILPLHDSGEADGFLFYVMPYIEGETLRQRIDREKQLAVEESIAITRKVADALDYAHDQGVVHRDIKPGNILLSERGEPLVADFGIALAVAHAGAGRITETGLSLGTPHYMSPEQATGDRDIDPRSDVYALGCVLYEMLSGDPPFSASSAQAVLVKILTMDAPSITSERRTVPPNVGSALARALEKLPADRFTTAAEFATALADESFTYQARPRTRATAPALEPTASASQVGSARPWHRDPRSMASLTAGLALAALAAWGWLGPTPTLQPTLSAIVLGDIALAAPDEIVVSSDGSRFATVGQVGGQVAIYWRNAAEERFRLLPGTENARFVAFSPDGEWLVYRSVGDEALMKVALSGGAPVAVVPAGLVSPRDPHWGDDGTIVFTGPQGQGLYRVPDTGGEPELLQEGRFRTPRLLPGGRGVIAVDLNGPTVVLVDLETDSVRELFPGVFDPMYVETGHLLYADLAGQLWAAAFDVRRSAVTGRPVPILGGISNYRGIFARYSVSRDGTLIYGAGGAGGGGDAGGRQLVIVDLDGNEQAPPLDTRFLANPRWSPDGESIVYADLGASDIYTYNVVLGTTPRRLTFEGANVQPVWSPDGSRVAFTSDRSGSRDLFVKSVIEDAPPESVLTLLGSAEFATHWPSNDLLLFREGEGSLGDLWMVDLSGDSAVARPYLEAEAQLDEIMLSPGGDLAAYMSNQAQRAGGGEVYVRSFPNPRQPEIVSQGGSYAPFWSPDGNTIYYWTPAAPGSIRTLMAARIERGPPFVVLSRDSLFSGAYGEADLHPEGDRIVTYRFGGGVAPAATGGATPEPERHVLVTNWFEELRRQVGN